MITTIRAAISILLLLGFYVLAAAIVGGLGYATWWLLVEHPGHAAGKLGYVTVVVAGAIAVGLWRVLRAKPELEDGVPVGPDRAPQLWQLVRELADQAKTAAPSKIMLVPEVNAAVAENARALGLVGGERRLYLGVPLLQGLTVGQLRSVLAHEIGHYSGAHTRLSAIAYRARVAIFGTAEQLSGSFVGWIFRMYGRLYRLVEAAVSRRRELEADQFSVRAAGRTTAQSALRELPVLSAAWGFYGERYVAPGFDAGYAPRDAFSGFGALLSARAGELAELRTEAPPGKKSKWDTHPPIATRIAAMESMPDAGASADPRPATDLIPMFDQACEALTSSALKVEQRTVLPWEQFAVAAIGVREQRQADQILRLAARLAGRPTADLGTVFDLAAAGRLGELVEGSGPEQVRREFAEAVELLLRVATTRAGVALRPASWSAETPVLITPAGQPLDLGAVARLAADPATVDQARERVAGLGIDLTQPVQVDAVATAHSGDLLDAMANIKVNEEPHDVLILDTGLIFVPCPKKTDNGKSRLLGLVRGASMVELATRNRFLPFEEIATAALLKEVPIKVEFTLHNGQKFLLQETWTGESLTKKARETLAAAAAQFIPEAEPTQGAPA